QRWVNALDDTHDVPSVAGVHYLIIGLEVKSDRDALQHEFRQVLLLLSSCLEIGIAQIRSAEKKVQELVIGSNAWSDRFIQARSRGEVKLRSPSASTWCTSTTLAGGFSGWGNCGAGARFFYRIGISFSQQPRDFLRIGNVRPLRSQPNDSLTFHVDAFVIVM